jgi:hypothetical protein
MRITKLTKIIVVSLILALSGQSLASLNASCMGDMPQQEHQMLGDTPCMDMDTPASPSTCIDCFCSSSGCNAAVVPTFQAAFELTPSLLTSSYAGLVENQLVPLLYRPPIAR